MKVTKRGKTLTIKFDTTPKDQRAARSFLDVMRGHDVDRTAYEDLGNLAAEHTRAIPLQCDACRVTWMGCAAAHHCPRCGDSKDWFTS